MLPDNTLLQGRYLIVEQIGRGGMGAVYKATDTRLRATVALKETLVGGEMLLKAFEREAQLLAGLRHPALPRVSDHFIEETGQFLVMEFIPGDDLATLLLKRGSPFPFGDVLRWGDQLLDALDYLHSRQPPVVHRDIKPQNMKLTDRGEIILLDFGLAKGAAMQTRVTGTSSIFGYTPHYAPLEQIQGTGTDPRSDLYSLAATLYHLLTGQAPIDALTRAAAKINEEPDPLLPASVVNPDVPPAVADVLARAMAQNASQRYPTAAAMRAALRDAITGQLVPPVNSAGMTTRLDHPPLVMVSGATDIQASRPPSQPGAIAAPLATGTTVTPPLSLGSGGTTITPVNQPTGLLKKPWLLAAIGGALALVAALGLLFARGGPNTSSVQPTSGPAAAILPTATEIERPTTPSLNATEIRQTVAAEVMADLTAEAIKRVTDIALARALVNATDSAGTQTAIALTPTGTSLPTEAPTAQPAAAAPTSGIPTQGGAPVASPKPNTAPAPKAPTAPPPTNTPRPAATAEPPKPSGSVITTGGGSMFRGSANLGDIPPEQGDGGSCIEGRVTTADGGLFESVGVQIDSRGNTRQAKVNIATGTYRMCGLAAGEWGISIYAAGGVDIPGSEQIAHQVRVKLSGQPGEIFFVNFRAQPGLIVPTPVPTPVASPYDGIWRGTNSGSTTTGEYPPGRFEIEVRDGSIYRISVDGPSCPFETYPNSARGVPINGNSFSVSGSVYHPITGERANLQINVRGSFTSQSSASGQLSAQLDGVSCASGTWKAGK
ncbi:MAG TPA: serine/threonine-protein kinase [Roseiflexaceae bacterium]|nr:serine/threonine-protein kinase [Roseiflexaceae bacterium]